MSATSYVIGISMGMAALLLFVAGAPGHALAMGCLALAAMFLE
jgi:hypothetical protein